MSLNKQLGHSLLNSNTFPYETVNVYFCSTHPTCKVYRCLKF